MMTQVNFDSIGGGGGYSDSGTESLSTSQNTIVNLSFKPKAIYYTTQNASGTGATYYYKVWWEESNPTEYARIAGYDSTGNGKTVGTVLDNRGELIDVGDNYFEVGKCDTTGYGTALTWYAIG